MYSSIQTSALLGVDALPVRVEVDEQNRVGVFVSILSKSSISVQQTRRLIFFTHMHVSYVLLKSY